MFFLQLNKKDKRFVVQQIYNLGAMIPEVTNRCCLD